MKYAIAFFIFLLPQASYAGIKAETNILGDRANFYFEENGQDFILELDKYGAVQMIAIIMRKGDVNADYTFYFDKGRADYGLVIMRGADFVWHGGYYKEKDRELMKMADRLAKKFIKKYDLGKLAMAICREQKEKYSRSEKEGKKRAAELRKKIPPAKEVLEKNL